ncbi:MAG: hypothetical protein C5B50_30370 [Verrucomicrobia bacterium]|nr:MAG: hypothetical protein C5B50_30370 [Verrucomicrobiota bacterium]
MDPRPSAGDDVRSPLRLPSKPFLPPRFALCLVICLWGLSFIATKTALREASPATLVALRFGLGTGLLFAVLRLRGFPLLPPRDAWPSLALMGFVGVFLHHLIQATGLTTTTATNAGWLIGLIPIWSALLSAALLKERFGFLKLAGLVGGTAGAILVISHGKPITEVLKLPSTHGDLLVLITTFTWAIYTVVGHGTIKRLGPLRATTGAMLLGWLMVLPVFLFTEGWRELSHLSIRGWGAILFLGIGCSAFGYLMWYAALERIEASRVASFLYAQPLVTAVAGPLLLHEQFWASTIAGGLLVLASVFVIQKAPVLKRAA